MEDIYARCQMGKQLSGPSADTVVKSLKLKSGDEIEIVITGDLQFGVERDRTRERALERLRALRTPLPKGFRFDRDEANAR